MMSRVGSCWFPIPSSSSNKSRFTRYSSVFLKGAREEGVSSEPFFGRGHVRASYTHSNEQLAAADQTDNGWSN